MPDIHHAVRRFVVEEFLPDVEVQELDPELDLLEEGVIDSLGLLKVIGWIESTYEIDTDRTDLDPEAFRSVTSIADWIEEVLPVAGPGTALVTAGPGAA